MLRFQPGSASGSASRRPSKARLLRSAGRGPHFPLGRRAGPLPWIVEAELGLALRLGWCDSTAVQSSSRRVARDLPNFDGKCAGMGMASCHITVIPPAHRALPGI